MRELGILFTRDNREAVAADRKTHTRRLGRLKKIINFKPDSWKFTGWEDGYACFSEKQPDDVCWAWKILPQWQVGDLLYVKKNYFTKKADAELWLLVTGVKDPHRIQDISEEDCVAEGIQRYEYGAEWDDAYGGRDKNESRSVGYGTQRLALSVMSSSAKNAFLKLWDSINVKPKPVYKAIDGKEVIAHYVSYPWEDIQETREHRGKPWHVCGNPFVFPYVFERIEK